jgi:D-alanyl-D-alanine carboxypeptidase/D-alanyl-D-alanine-endopeptidase (penicillin-binding protein 4)
MNKKHVFRFLCLVITALALSPAMLRADTSSGPLPLQTLLSPLLGPKDAAMVTDSHGRILAAVNCDTLLIPASSLKILTCLAALHTLGADFRFATEFYLAPGNSLIIKGYGDPLLVSERLPPIAERLREQIDTIHDIILDATYFAQPIVIPGRNNSTQPYDAPNGALCINFNTVNFKIEKGRWVSAEPQTPLLPSVVPKIKASGLKAGRITLPGSSRESLIYAGDMFRYFLIQAGIKVTGAALTGQVDSRLDRLLYRYLSEDELTVVLSSLLEFSNNFIANQLLLAMGAHVYGPPATVEKGLTVLRNYYQSEIGIRTGHLAEASGISRKNRVSARAMMRLVERFEPYHTLMRHQGRQWYKTGTLNGIATRVGYLTTQNSELCRFVVMINTPGKSPRKVMRIIEKQLK